MAHVLLGHGADADKATTDDGVTPLLTASTRGHASIVTALIEAGAAVNLAMHDGATPLFFASQQGHTKMAAALLAAGAAVDQ